MTSATFERALRGLAGFRWRGLGFRPWLFRIAANELADHYRREGRAARTPLLLVPEGRDEAEDEDSVAPARLEEVLSALDGLIPRYQRAISLRYLAGLSHEEAAAALGCTKPVMAVTLHRALVALRRTVERGNPGRAR